jgi:putative SOS response-associated peptidase YedK
MCGYLRRHIKPRTLKEFLELLGLKSYGVDWEDNHPAIDEPVLEHFYPAFGGDVNKTIKGLLIKEGGELKLVDATWWYHAEEVDGQLVLGPRRTFNARRLYINFWRDAIQHHRAIAIVTGLGEGKKVDGKDKHFLVTSERLMLLGAVYKKFPSGKYTCAIITRDEHPRFKPYHDHAFPLFLPPNLEFLNRWLSDIGDDDPDIAQLLASRRIFSDLTIKPVKTFKGEVATGPTEYLKAD